MLENADQNNSEYGLFHAVAILHVRKWEIIVDSNNSFRCVPYPLLHNDGDWGDSIVLHRVCCWSTLSSKCHRLLEENASSINGSWNILRGYLHVAVYLLYLRYCMVLLLFLCILYIKITMAFRELSWVSNKKPAVRFFDMLWEIRGAEMHLKPSQ